MYRPNERKAPPRYGAGPIDRPSKPAYLAKRRTNLKPSVATITAPTMGARVGTTATSMLTASVATVVASDVIALVMVADPPSMSDTPPHKIDDEIDYVAEHIERQREPDTHADVGPTVTDKSG